VAAALLGGPGGGNLGLFTRVRSPVDDRRHGAFASPSIAVAAALIAVGMSLVPKMTDEE
jgi:hypothetical protein